MVLASSEDVVSKLKIPYGSLKYCLEYFLREQSVCHSAFSWRMADTSFPPRKESECHSVCFLVYKWCGRWSSPRKGLEIFSAFLAIYMCLQRIGLNLIIQKKLGLWGGTLTCLYNHFPDLFHSFSMLKAQVKGQHLYLNHYCADIFLTAFGKMLFPISVSISVPSAKILSTRYPSSLCFRELCAQLPCH